MKFYLVTCHRGHCGTGHSVDITFAFRARNLLDACDSARSMPGVKHTRLVISGREITEFEYIEYTKVSAYHR